jgi:hypothetical protein
MLQQTKKGYRSDNITYINSKEEQPKVYNIKRLQHDYKITKSAAEKDGSVSL